MLYKIVLFLTYVGLSFGQFEPGEVSGNSYVVLSIKYYNNNNCSNINKTVKYSYGCINEFELHKKSDAIHICCNFLLDNHKIYNEDELLVCYNINNTIFKYKCGLVEDDSSTFIITFSIMGGVIILFVGYMYIDHRYTKRRQYQNLDNQDNRHSNVL